MTDTNQKPFITMAALRKIKFPESNWIVDGLLRTGLRCPASSLLSPRLANRHLPGNSPSLSLKATRFWAGPRPVALWFTGSRG